MGDFYCLPKSIIVSALNSFFLSKRFPTHTPIPLKGVLGEGCPNRDIKQV